MIGYRVRHADAAYVRRHHIRLLRRVHAQRVHALINSGINVRLIPSVAASGLSAARKAMADDISTSSEYVKRGTTVARVIAANIARA